MNDTEFETLARTSAATLRAKAERIADSDSALQALLEVAGSSTPVGPGHAGDAEIIDLENAIQVRRRPIWMPLTAAAAVIVAIGGVVFLANGSADDPAVTTEPITAPVTTPAVVPVPDGTTAPLGTVEASPVETTQPVDDTIVETMDEVVAIGDVRGPQLERTVLATYEVGSGDGALGFEQCQECDPLTPWAPIVTDDGTIFVADGLNTRWMIFRDGAWSSQPYRDGEVVTAAPVVGPDGLIYAMVADELRQGSPRHIVSYEPDGLTEVESYPQGSGFEPLELVDGNVAYSTIGGYVALTDFTRPASSATATIDWSTNEVEMSISGITRGFQFPADWFLDPAAPYSASDGSVVVTASAPAAAGSLEDVLVRLWVDGSSSVALVGPYGSSAYNSETRFASDGLIRLEDGEIVRYAWPEFTAPDPLAGWEFPQFAEPNLDAVPYLVPTVKTPTGVVSERTEWAGPVSERVSYVQTWARANDTGAVTGIVQLTTSLDPNLVTAVDRAVEISGWDQAYFNASTPEVTILRLHTATRSMVVWTSGLDQDTTAQIARSLKTDDDGAGWATPFTSSSDTWTPIAQGWSAGMASRTFRQSVPGQPLTLELWTAAGVPDAVGTPGLTVSPDAPMTLVDVNGRTALVTDRGFNSAVTWQETPEVVVLLGVDGSIDEALATARSITEVDRATWLASAVEQQGDGDGCDGMFC